MPKNFNKVKIDPQLNVSCSVLTVFASINVLRFSSSISKNPTRLHFAYDEHQPISAFQFHRDAVLHFLVRIGY